VTDAAFCLFVHSLAIETAAYSPRWPTSVARQLGLAVAGTTDAD
jgi:hypothetical protein